jgi:probable addiction module antidote protein
VDKEHILKNTESYHDELIQSLKDSDEAFGYLQVALEEYQEDHNTEALLVALRNVAMAQGGIAKLAKKTRLNRQNLYNILSKKGNPRLDTFGSIIQGLGFKLAIGH